MIVAAKWLVAQSKMRAQTATQKLEPGLIHNGGITAIQILSVHKAAQNHLAPDITERFPIKIFAPHAEGIGAQIARPWRCFVDGGENEPHCRLESFECGCGCLWRKVGGTLWKGVRWQVNIVAEWCSCRMHAPLIASSHTVLKNFKRGTHSRAV
jgi:hypothetical protein